MAKDSIPPIARSRKSARIRSRTLTPHAHQRFVWDALNDDQYVVIAAIAGHHGGKTHLGPYWIFDEAAKYPGDDFIICGPTYGTLRKGAVPKFLSLAEVLGLPTRYNEAYGVGYRSADHEYHLPGGGIVYFVSGDRVGGAQGAHCRGAWLDETVNTKYDVYETLLGRIAGLEGKLLITTTPYDMDWLYERVYTPWKENKAPEIFCHQWRSIDNPNFSKKRWALLKNTFEDWRFKMLYEGQFERPIGLVYDCFVEDSWVEPFEIPPEWKRTVGIDWGFVDPMAAIWIAEAPDGTHFAYDEYYRSGWFANLTPARRQELVAQGAHATGAFMHIEEMLDEIVARSAERGERINKVIWDAADPDMGAKAVEKYRKIGCSKVYPSLKGGGSVVAGIGHCYQQVRGGRFKVFKTLQHFADERGKYHWQVDPMTGEPLRKATPSDVHNHIMDAWRYAETGSSHEPKGMFAVGKIAHAGDDIFAAMRARKKARGL